MKKLLFILFLLPVFCFAQTNFTPQFKRNIPADSLIGYSISGVTGNHWLPDTAWVKRHAGAFIPTNFTDTVKVTQNGFPLILKQHISSAGLDIQATETSDGRATIKFTSSKGSGLHTQEIGLYPGGASASIGFGQRNITNNPSGVDMVWSTDTLTDVFKHWHPVIFKNVPNSTSPDSGAAFHGDTLVRTALPVTYSAADGIKIGTGSPAPISIDTNVVKRLGPTYINQTASDVITLRNYNVSSGTIISKQVLNPGAVGNGIVYQSTNHAELWNETASSYTVDVYSSTNHGLTFTLILSNTTILAGHVLGSGSFLLVTDHGVSPVLPIIYPTPGSGSPTGGAGGDLGGTYPNPTVNQINSITKSFYDPTSSIQTQLNGKQATLVSGTNLKTVNSTTLLGSGNLAITTANTDTTATGFRTATNSKSLAQEQTALNLKANLASPTFTGVPAAPTATVGTNTTQIATTAFVIANSGTPTFANPSASIGVTPVNGSATTAMRSDAAPKADTTTLRTTANSATLAQLQTKLNLKQNSFKYFNVVDYGADITGVSDSRDAIQSAINAAYANKGGVVYFPFGKYLVHGALVNSGGTGIGSPNSQLYIQFVSSATGTQGSIPIVLLGEEMPSPNASALANYTINKGGPIIYSDIAGSGTLPAILGSDQSASVGGFNLASVTVRNLDFRVAANIGASGPTMSALNLYNVAFAEVDHVVCELDTSSNLSVSPSAETFGIYMPKVNNGAWCPINNILVTGYKYGIILTEHCVWNNLSVTTCEEGYVFPGAIHSLSGGRMLAQWCKNTLSGPIGSIVAPSGNPSTTELNIQELDIEWQPSGTGNWFDKNVIVLDASNNLYGHIYYHMVKRGVGVDNSGYNKSGGTNLYADAILTNQFTTVGLNTPSISGPTASGTLVISSNSTTPGFINFGTTGTGGVKDGNPPLFASGLTNPTAQFSAKGTGGASNQGYEINFTGASSYANMMNVFNNSGTDAYELYGTGTSFSASPIGSNEVVLGHFLTAGGITMYATGAGFFRSITNGLERFKITSAGNWNLNTTAGAANQVPMSNGTIMGWQTIAPFLGSGQTTLVAGTKAISVTGVTTSSKAFVQAVSQGGTVSTTFEYSAVCTSGTVTITAITTGNVTNTLDTSTLNYYVIN